MIGEPENDRCYFCGGTLMPGLTTLPFVIATKIVVIKGVPAEVCTQCHEAIMASEVAGVVDQLLKQVQRTGFEVSIVPYEQLTLVPA